MLVFRKILRTYYMNDPKAVLETRNSQVCRMIKNEALTLVFHFKIMTYDETLSLNTMQLITLLLNRLTYHSIVSLNSNSGVGEGSIVV